MDKKKKIEDLDSISLPFYKRWQFHAIVLGSVVLLLLGTIIVIREVSRLIDVSTSLSMACTRIVFLSDEVHPCVEQAKLVREALVTHKQALLEECPDLNEDLQQAAIDDPKRVTACAEAIGILQDL